jgi:hypothetical protein
MATRQHPEWVPVEGSPQVGDGAPAPAASGQVTLLQRTSHECGCYLPFDEATLGGRHIPASLVDSEAGKERGPERGQPAAGPVISR